MLYLKTFFIRAYHATAYRDLAWFLKRRLRKSLTVNDLRRRGGRALVTPWASTSYTH